MSETYKAICTPIGPLTIGVTDTAVTSLSFGTLRATSNTRAATESEQRVIDSCAEQLAEYFAGARKSFDIPLSPSGTTFQQSVWTELRKIPYGTTINYGEQARRIGKPHASRAVGAANGKNPIAIIVPCHRVVGASGRLTGFAGGMEMKKAVLDLEFEHTTIFS